MVTVGVFFLETGRGISLKNFEKNRYAPEGEEGRLV